jgi:type II secretory pathway predicted ATPase ExeA
VYTAHFGLREKPFNVTPDPRFYYANPVYREAYASLLSGVQERKGFVVMTGEVGTGKTTLLRMLMANLEATVRFAYLYNTTLSFEEILTYTCDELGIAVEGGGRLARIQALNAFLIEQLRRGGTGALFIDEAQNLEPDVLENLRLLSNLETSTEKLLQIVLVGQPELEAKLAQPGLRQLRQRVSVQCRLDRLKDREVEDYIRLRLETAGARRADLFERAAVERIAVYSTGIPRLINIICDNALVVAYATSAKRVAASMVEEVASDLGLVSPPPSAPPAAAAVEPVPAPAALPRAEPRTAAEVLRRRALRRPRQGRWAMGTRVGALVVLVAVGAALVLWAPHVTGQIAAMGASIKDGWSRVMLSRPRSQRDATERGAAAETGPAPRAQDAGAVPESPAAATASPAPPAGPPSTAAPAGRALALPPRPAEPPRTAAERPGAVAPGRPIVVPHGATVADIALKTYGGYNLLAIDLIKGLNPHIGNLNWIRAGEQLRLPALDAATLIRQQADGSYHLIIGSFLSSQAAERTRDRLRRAGFQATSTTRRLTDNLEVHRVELTGLPTREVAQQAWNTARANCWLQITDGPCERTTHG